MIRWWHRAVQQHTQVESRVTVGMYDSSRGILVKCDCGKMWAL